MKKMKNIIIYGSGCATCHKLQTLIETIVKEHAIPAKVQYSSDFAAMAKLGILSLPAVVIDGQIKAAGTIPKRAEILKWLEQ